ncbi:hypothetical protein [Burkholderia sp. BDU5]|uniref:hypothetical protein n=1 Tax=Burkholderia sp. BDU5 TaxID=1385590 RepID=UPI000B0741CA|nr:hypothetical protein [Burkholderia sp. BDU5]
MSGVARVARACALRERAPDMRCVAIGRLGGRPADGHRGARRRATIKPPLRGPFLPQTGHSTAARGRMYTRRKRPASRQRSHASNPLPQTLATLLRGPFEAGNYGKIGNSIPNPRRNVRKPRRQRSIRAVRSRNAVEKWGGIKRDAGLRERLNGASIISRELIKT